MISIACDARPLIGPRTGVGTWALEVMTGLARRPDTRVLLASHSGFDVPRELGEAGAQPIASPRPRLPGTLWLHSVLPTRLASTGVDVFVASLAVAPRRCPVPVVTMVHDLTPFTHPNRHTLANRFCFNAYLAESLERAHAVVVGSRATQEVVLGHFPWVKPRLHRIGYGIDSFFSPADNSEEGHEVRARFSAGHPYLLHLGTLEPRKGVDLLIAAWERLRSTLPAAPDLVLAGKPGWHMGPLKRQIERSAERAHIHLPGYVSRRDARGLLRHAAVFVLASEAEGFGLPLAEALACGAPCVVSDIPVLREVAGDAALFVLPRDAEAMADALARALEPENAAALQAAGLKRAPALHWQPVVQAWHHLVHEVVDAARGGSASSG